MPLDHVRLSKEGALEKLRRQLKVIPELRPLGRFSPEFKKWHRDTSIAIERIFGSDGRHLADFNDIRYTLMAFSTGTPDSAFEEAFQDGLSTAEPILQSLVEEVQEYWPDSENIRTAAATDSRGAIAPFIAPERLGALRRVQSESFDLSRLIRLAEELEISFNHGAYHAVASLTRALIDHVPPIFGCLTFAEVANNYGGGRSFRQSMQHLEKSARRIGDAHLHGQIRTRESLPTSTQVNFSNDLDVLLAEVVRLLEDLSSPLGEPV